MHIKGIIFLSDQYPTRNFYPFNKAIFRKTKEISFTTPVTFFVGENGSGKSTLLKALVHKCGIHMWRDSERQSLENNPYEELLYRYIRVQWTNGRVPGSFFSSEMFQNFAQYLDEWAMAGTEILDYFGGKSLSTQSHGQSLMSYFRARYKRRGLYFLDEPETALSPKSQLQLLSLLQEMGRAGHAQFIIATHSPILLACPGARIYNFDTIPISLIEYEDTEHYRIYREFFKNPERVLS
ncbi:MAG: AAA family ATPase [Deltaproteobacteria bacterium]|nr:AAA family ATPase [Deltaproteobacteria bacterium]